MSIAFDKRDYVYNGDELEYERCSSEDEEDEIFTATDQSISDKMPNEWVFDLFQDLKDISNNQAVHLLDRCEVSDFAIFLSNYSEDVFEKNT